LLPSFRRHTEGALSPCSSQHQRNAKAGTNPKLACDTENGAQPRPDCGAAGSAFTRGHVSIEVAMTGRRTRLSPCHRSPHLGSHDPCERHNGWLGSRALGPSFRLITCGYPGNTFQLPPLVGFQTDITQPRDKLACRLQIYPAPATKMKESGRKTCLGSWGLPSPTPRVGGGDNKEAHG
jgi:hypothetical protein